jgi:hypothetical protein
VSTYGVQQCLFDHLRALERATGQDRPAIIVEGYQLTDAERDALVSGDVATLYEMGTHPVLINGYCRAQGYKRADYRVLFRPTVGGVEGSPRWRRS